MIISKIISLDVNRNILVQAKRILSFCLSKHASLYSILFGTLAFLWFVGFHALNPRNTTWIYNSLNSDPIAHYLGWLFFKDSSQGWSIPIGANPNYGLEISSSVLYSDSIPLMAILGKIIAPAIVNDFQYFGIWLLLCFILQTYFSFKVIELFTGNLLLCCLTSSLFSTLPMFLWRIQSHIALTSHFLVVWAIYLILKLFKYRKDQSGQWLVLLIISSLVHPYLLAMILALWLGAFASLLSLGLNHWRRNFMVLLVTVIGLTLSCFLIAGYDLSNTNSKAGTSVEFGTYRWNLLAPLVSYGFSLFFSSLQASSGNFESYTYLGAGFWLIFAIVLKEFRRSSRLSVKTLLRFKWVSLILACLTLLSITHKVAIGSLRFEFHLPVILIEPLSIFYASARFIWPTIYFILFFLSLYLIKNFRMKTSVTLIAIALIVQAVDTFPLARELRTFTTNSKFPTNKYLENEVLIEKVSGKYKKLVVILNGETIVQGFPELTLFAYELGMGTNSIYLARVDEKKVADYRQKLENVINLRAFSQDTVYVAFGDELKFNTIDQKFEIISVSGVDFLLP